MIISIIAGMQKQNKDADLVAKGRVIQQGISPQTMPDDKAIVPDMFVYTLLQDYGWTSKREPKIKQAH